MSDDSSLDEEGQGVYSYGRGLPEVVASRLSESAVWSEPAPDLGDRIVAAIAAERRTSSALTHSAAPSTVSELRTRTRSTRSARWLLAAAAAVAVIGAAVVVMTVGDDDEPPDAEPAAVLDGTELAPGASAGVDAVDDGNGVAILLEIEDLPPAPEGSYYQGWVRNAEDEGVSIGTFHMRDGDGKVTLWSGVDLGEYRMLTITLQREGEGPASSGEVVLRGDVGSLAGG